MSPENLLLENILKFWDQHQLLTKSLKLVIGVSGGLDSQVLLHALVTLRQELGLNLHVATLDHGLRGAAGAADADFVEQLAQDWGVPVTRGTVDVWRYVDDYGLNVEEAARQARYSFLLETANTYNASHIAVAHHHDDQAETVLMHLIRGTGLYGLRGILPITPLSEYHLLDYELDEMLEYLPEDFILIRPLLYTPRKLIEAYASSVGIQPRQDETNDDLTRFRNTLRHEILPRLTELNPNINTILGNLAEVVQAEIEVLEGRLESVAAWLLEWDVTEPLTLDDDEGEVVYLDRESFAEQPVAIQRGLIRKVIFELSAITRDLSFEQTEAVRQLILNGETGTRMDLPDGLYLAIGYDEALIAYGGVPYYPAYLPSLRPGEVIELDIDGQGYLTEHQRLISYWVVEGLSKDLHPADPLECTLAVPSEAKLSLRTRREGDRFRPLGMEGKSQKLADTFTNLKVPIYYRDQVPLLTVNDEIAWFVVPSANGPVGRIAESFAVKPDSPSILRLRWQMAIPSPDPDEGV
jgi:tRNA(Ile)-lysidine synthase